MTRLFRRTFDKRAPAQVTRLRLAAVRDRCAAQMLDVMICALLLWYTGITLAHRYGGIGISAEGVEIDGTPALTAGAVFAAGIFLYFFLLESTLGATAGKLLCRISVQREGQRGCGLAAALVRTACRPVDALIGPVLMATSDKVQTLGDRIAGTTVVKVEDALPLSVQDRGRSAGWEVRTKAAVIDLAVLILFVAAYLFATKSLVIHGHVRINLRGIALLVLVELVFFYFAAFEAMFGGTIGKLACNIRVLRLDGAGCGFIESTIRTICRPIDICTAGVLPFLLVRYTPAGRHLGDRLAGTVVVESVIAGKAKFWTAAAVVSASCALAAVYPFLKLNP